MKNIFRHIKNNKVGNLLMLVVTLAIVLTPLYPNLFILWKIWTVVTLIIFTFMNLTLVLANSKIEVFENIYTEKKILLPLYEDYQNKKALAMIGYVWFWRLIDIPFLIIIGSDLWTVLYVIGLFLLVLQEHLAKNFINSNKDKILQYQKEEADKIFEDTYKIYDEYMEGK